MKIIYIFYLIFLKYYPSNLEYRGQLRFNYFLIKLIQKGIKIVKYFCRIE